MLSAYFRDMAHKKTMLELLHERDAIQGEAREELRRKFREFDIECVDVLIGKPDTAEAGGKIETLLEQLRHAAAVDRADRNLRTPAGGGREAADAQRGPGPGRDADAADQLAACRCRSPRTRARPSWPGPASRPSRLVVVARPAMSCAADWTSPGRADVSGRGREQQRMLAGRGEAAVCRSVCRKRRCCCARSARSAIRGCMPCRWWPSTCRTAVSRWCPSESSWPAATGENGARRGPARACWAC